MIEELLKEIARTLDKARIPYMIIGGQAVLVHGRPRLTQDVDVTLGVDTDWFQRVLNCCRALKFSPLRKDPERFVTQTKVLPVADSKSGFRVDFIFSNTPYEQQAIRRATVLRLDGYPVRFASAEDLIIHKVLAGRAIDLEDVKAVLLRKGSRLDKVTIRKWLKLFVRAVGNDRDLLTTWDRLCKEVRS